MAKWKVEQRRFDPAKTIWSGEGLWEVPAATPVEALEHVFKVYLERGEEFKQYLPLVQIELYGAFLTVDDKSWSVRPAGAGVPG